MPGCPVQTQIAYPTVTASIADKGVEAEAARHSIPATVTIAVSRPYIGR
jgi:hypothetical protein